MFVMFRERKVIMYHDATAFVHERYYLKF